MEEAITFSSVNQTLYPDTCQPLKQAAERGDIHLSALGRARYPGTPLKDNDLPGLRSLGVWDARKAHLFGLPQHCNEGIEFCLCETGQLTFCCEQQRYQLSANQVTVTRPWQPHQLGDPDIDACRLHWLILDVGVRSPHQVWNWPDWIILDKALLNDFTQLLRGSEKPLWSGSQAIVRSFQLISELLPHYGSPETSSRLKLLINELLLNLYQSIKSHQPRLDEQLTSSERSVRLFIQLLEQVPELDWSSEDMANYCHLKSTRFIYYCKKLTNLSPIQYLHCLRVKKAQQALMTSSSSITDIALDCGFSSSQYFNRVFKKLTGETPHEYRQRLSKAHHSERL
ncbi:AraC family transcriptional regulator [Vibrio sp. WXL210]|uniref:helix-turn-helix transcriptional regulator n=1 Tax=Vibrio sp. WXL210 TaxID=3450709 RepID=UPI003EC4C127